MDASPPTIARAVRQVLAEPRFGQAAQRFAATLAATNPKELIVAELEDLLPRGAAIS
jgi:hypothetical protein